MAEGPGLVIGVVATPQQWRRDLQAHVTDHVQGVTLRVLHDPADSRDVDVVIIDDTFDFLTRAEVVALSDHGIRVLGVFDETGRIGRGRRPLDALGIEAIARADRPDALLQAAATLDPAAARRRTSPPAPSAPRPEAARPGRVEPSTSVVAVGGGSGAPGRSEVAIGLAGVLADRGAPTVLVDVDEHDPSLAPRLGFEPVPNLLDAVTAAAQSGRMTPSCLGRRAGFATVPIPFDVICGLASVSDWSQTRELGRLIERLRQEWRYVVLDSGPYCGPDQIPPGGARNAATRASLRAADHVVAVCSATPLGVLRLLQWATSAIELMSSPAVTVLVNRAPAERYQRGELLDQITRNLPAAAVAAVEFVPIDKAVTAAAWDAKPLANGSLRATLESLVTSMPLLPVSPAESPRRRRFATVGALR